MLNIGATAYGVGPYFVAVFFLYSDFDPIFKFQSHVLTTDYSVTWGFLILRYIGLIPTFQMCRLVSLAFSMITIGTYMCLSCISFLVHNAPIISLGRSYVLKILLGNDAINIIFQNLSKAISTAVSVIMLSGLVLATSVNFMTIKMHSIMPMPMYLIFLAAAAIIPIIAKVMMPMVINVYVGGNKAAWKWKVYFVLCKDIKYVTRMVGARQGPRINVGVFGFRFFFVKESTKVTYYYNLLSTITALMSVDVKKLQIV